MWDPNSFFFRKKLGVKRPLLITRHRAGVGFMVRVCLNLSYPFQSGIFSASQPVEVVTQFGFLSERSEPCAVYPGRREIQKPSNVAILIMSLIYFFLSVLPPITVHENSRCSVNIYLIRVKEHYKMYSKQGFNSTKPNWWPYQIIFRFYWYNSKKEIAEDLQI